METERALSIESAARVPVRARQSEHRISKQTLDRLEGIERFKREQCEQNLCFSSRPFVLCGLNPAVARRATSI